MNQTGCCDELVGRIPLEVEPRRRARHGEVQRPDMDAAQRAHYFWIIEIESDSAKLYELGKLPQHDRSDTPRVPCEQAPLCGAHVSTQRVNQNMCVKIQHRHPRQVPWR